MSFIVPERVAKTVTGELVPWHSTDAAFLAFAAGDQVSDEEADRLGVRAYFEKSAPKAEDKSASVPQNKMATAPDDKSELDSLRETAKALGVKVDGRWNADRLRTEIADAKA